MRAPIRRIVTCCVAVIMSSACGREPLPLGFGMPILRFETSESHGAGRGFVGLALGGTPRAVMVNDAGTVPPDTSRRVGAGRVATYSAGVGVLNRLDVSIAHSADHGPEGPTPLMVRTKFQLIGAPAKSAKEGANSLAVMAGAGTVGFDRTASVTFEELTSQGLPAARGGTVTSHAEATAVQAAVVGGHRITDRALFYGSLAYTEYRFNWTVDQTSDRGLRHFEDAGRIGQVSAGAGMQYARRAMFVRAEAAISRESFGPNRQGMSAGVQTGLKW